MEVFSLLKYWRTSNGGGGGGVETHLATHSLKHPTTITTTATSTNTTSCCGSSSVSASTVTTAGGGDCGEESDRDDGPFFDLEFTVPDRECEEEDEDEGEGEGSEVEDDEFDFAVDSSCSTGNRTDPNLTLSPSDDLFFNGRFVPLEPAEFGFSSAESSSKLQFPGSLLKPATKLRVLMLGFKKPKSAPEAKQTRNKASFTVKLKVEEEDPVTILSLFSSSRNPNTSKSNREDILCCEEQTQKFANKEAVAAVGSGSDDRKFTKDVLQKYLKMVKPLYFKVSKKSTGFSGQLNVNSSSPVSVNSPSKKTEGELAAAAAAAGTTSTSVKNAKEGNNLGNVRGLREGNLTAGLRNVRKHLGKSRSASSAAVASVPSATAMAVQSRRHDDSLLQQQDGIQSAIMHCKRSFTASRDSEPNPNPNSSSLSRCTSDPSHEKSKSITKAANSSRISLDETRIK